MLILSAEDDPADTLRPRLEEMGANLRRVRVLRAVRDVDPNTGEPRERAVSLARDIPRLAAALDEIPDCRLLIVDPLSAYLGGGVDSHVNSDVRGVLAPLAGLAADRGLAVIAVHHLNKAASGAAIYRASGSLAFVAAARAVWLVAADPDDAGRRIVAALKNNLAPDVDGMGFRIRSLPPGTPTLIWEHAAVRADPAELLRVRSDGTRSSTRDSACEWLCTLLARGPLPVSELRTEADGAGFSWPTIRRAKDEAGVVVSRDGFGPGGRWTWSLPERESTIGDQ